MAEFLLAEVQDGEELLCRMCVELPTVTAVPPSVREELHDAARRLSVPLGHPAPLPTPPSQAESQVLIGVITPEVTADARARAHRSELFVVDGVGDRATPVPIAGATVLAKDYAQARIELQRMLDRHLVQSPVKADIQIAVPDEFLRTENLHTWRRTPDDPKNPLRFTHDYLIELRRTATWERTEEQSRQLSEHWSALDRMRPGDDAMNWVLCRDARDREELQDALEDAAGMGVWDPPKPDLLYLADINALAVMVWRNNDCADHGLHHPCSGAAFHSALYESFGDQPPTRWSEKIHRVQRRAARNRLTPQAEGYAWRDVIYINERPATTGGGFRWPGRATGRIKGVTYDGASVARVPGGGRAARRMGPRPRTDDLAHLRRRPGADRAAR